MDGRPVFKWAAFTMAEAAADVLDAAGVGPEEIEVFVPHQANKRITDAMLRALKLPEHVVVARDIERHGNNSAASIPLAMDTLLASGEAKRPDLPGHRLRCRPGVCRSGDRAAMIVPNPRSRARPLRRSVHRSDPKEPRSPMPTTEEVRADLADIVNEVAGVPADDVQLDKSFTDDLDVDSLSMVEIIYAAEEKFSVSIPDEEAKNLKTVGDAVAYIERAAS